MQSHHILFGLEKRVDVGLHQRQIVKQPSVPLLCCCIRSLSLGPFCNVGEILEERKMTIKVR